MRLLNLNLQAFLAVHEKGSVSAAAAVLGIGQTGVTQRIRSLEKELGVTLFSRSRRGMKLTLEGQSILKYCLRSIELEGQTLNDLKHSGTQFEVDLRIGGPTSFISGRAILSCQEFLRKWSRLNLHFCVDDRDNRLELIKRDLVDLVVLYPHQVPLEMDSKLLKPDEYILLGHPSWKKRELKEVIADERLFAFHEQDQTSLNYLKAFGLIRYLKRSRLFVNENRALASLLKQGVGFGLLSKEIAEPFLQNGELIQIHPGHSLKDPLALAWYPRSEMPAYMKELIQAIK